MPGIQDIVRWGRRVYLTVQRRFRAVVDVARFWWQVRSHADLRIVVGSSGKYQPGWIPTDREYLDLLIPKHWRRAFGTRRASVILAEHVFEHLTEAEGEQAIGVCAQYLKPGGYLRVAVPDGYCPDPRYINYVKPGGTGSGSDDHKVLYNVDTLTSAMLRCGLVPEPLEWYSSQGAFSFKDWDPTSGLIERSRRFDERNAGGRLAYTSLIVDGRRPAD